MNCGAFFLKQYISAGCVKWGGGGDSGGAGGSINNSSTTNSKVFKNIFAKRSVGHTQIHLSPVSERESQKQKKKRSFVQYDLVHFAQTNARFPSVSQIQSSFVLNSSCMCVL